MRRCLARVRRRRRMCSDGPVMLPGDDWLVLWGAPPLPPRTRQEHWVPTFHFQESLAKLPAPRADAAVRRLQAHVDGIGDEDAGSQLAPELDAFAAAAASGVGSVTADGDDVRTAASVQDALADRRPLPYQSCCVVLREDPDPEQMEMLNRAAALLRAAVQLQLGMEDGTEPPQVGGDPGEAAMAAAGSMPRRVSTPALRAASLLKAEPLSMHLWKGVLRRTRRAKVSTVDVQRWADQPARHAVVMHKGNAYKVTVARVVQKQLRSQAGAVSTEPTNKDRFGPETYETETLPLRVDLIHAQLRQIAYDAGHGAARVPFGTFTALDRNQSGFMWDNLERSQVNRASAFAVETAMCVLCLDPSSGGASASPRGHASFCAALRHGPSRWWDKAVNIVVGRDGSAAVLFERAAADMATARAVAGRLWQLSTGFPATQERSAAEKPELLEWAEADVLKRSADEANARPQPTAGCSLRRLSAPRSADDAATSFAVTAAAQLAWARRYRGAVAPCSYFPSTLSRARGATRHPIPCVTPALREWLQKQPDEDRVTPAADPSLLRRALADHEKLFAAEGWPEELMALAMLSGGPGVKGVMRSAAFESATRPSITVCGCGAETTAAFASLPPDGVSVSYSCPAPTSLLVSAMAAGGNCQSFAEEVCSDAVDILAALA